MSIPTLHLALAVVSPKSARQMALEAALVLAGNGAPLVATDDPSEPLKLCVGDLVNEAAVAPEAPCKSTSRWPKPRRSRREARRR